LIQGLKDDGLDVEDVKVIDGKNTGVAVIIVEESIGENRILFNPGANYSLRPEDFKTAESLGTPKPEAVILQLEIPLDTVLAIIELCKAEGISVLFNPAPAVPLPDAVFRGLDHLIVNETEAAILSGRTEDEVNAEGFDFGVVADEFLGKGVSNVVITLGGKGSYSSSQVGQGQLIPANKVKVVDTTCAGDTFVGRYGVEWVRSRKSKQEWDITKAVKLSAKASEVVVGRHGAQVAIPWGDEL
jgi:ribokinase